MITLDIPKIKTIYLELDDEMAPKTMSSFLKCIPFDVKINSWGKDLYTNECRYTRCRECKTTGRFNGCCILVNDVPLIAKRLRYPFTQPVRM